MEFKTCFLLLSLSFLACSQADSQTEVAEISEAQDDVFTSVELALASNISIANNADSSAIEPLRKFFAEKMLNEGHDNFWLQADIDRYKKPFAALRYCEFDSNAIPKYKPMLMRVRNTSVANERLLTVRWAAYDSTGTAADVRYVFDFISTPTPNGYRLALPTDYLTANWQRIQKGYVNYIVSPEHDFSISEAEQQAEQIEKLSSFFNMPAFPITFYSCAGPADLFRAQGFQYHPLMYVHETGGMVDHGEYVWSGNDRDRYTHEIVHVFTNRKFERRQALLDEGLATILGGSSDRPYAYHRKVFSTHLLENPSTDLIDYLLTTQQAYIKDHTSMPYLVGALICEYVYERIGKAGLFELMDSGSDPWSELNKLDLTKENLNEVIREQLKKPATLSL